MRGGSAGTRSACSRRRGSTGSTACRSRRRPATSRPRTRWPTTSRPMRRISICRCGAASASSACRRRADVFVVEAGGRRYEARQVDRRDVEVPEAGRTGLRRHARSRDRPAPFARLPQSRPASRRRACSSSARPTRRQRSRATSPRDGRSICPAAIPAMCRSASRAASRGTSLMPFLLPRRLPPHPHRRYADGRERRAAGSRPAERR